VRCTQENISVDNAQQAHKFSQDDYFTHHKVRSVLCGLILHQGKLTGIIYSENNLARNVEVLRIILIEYTAIKQSLNLDLNLLFANILK